MRMPRLSLPLFLLAGVLTGCVTPSQEQVERDVGEAAQEQAPATPSQWEVAADSGAVQAGWIEAFGDRSHSQHWSSRRRQTTATWRQPQRTSIVPGHLAREAGAALTPDVKYRSQELRSIGEPPTAARPT